MAGLDGDDTSATVYLDDLNPLNPDTDDPKSQGDNHLRFVKRTLVNTFPNITGPVTATQAELNALDGITATVDELNYTDGVTSNIQTQLDGKAEITRSRKNLLINGGMDVWQRGSSGSLPTSVYTYMADRWCGESYGAAAAWGQGNTPTNPSVSYGASLVISGATGCTSTAVRQRIEARNAYHTYNKKLTASFKLYATGTAPSFTARIYYPNSVNVFTSVTQIEAVSLAAHPGGGAWVNYEVTFTTSMPQQVANGLEFLIVTGALGAGAAWAITDVQLEIGEEATDFDRCTSAETLNDCQRYYEAGSACYAMFYGNVTSGNNYYATNRYATPKRALATLAFPAAYSVSSFNTSSPTIAVNSWDGFLAFKTATATGLGIWAWQWTADAEL